MKEKVEAALKKIRPSLQADGGDVELVDVKNGIVRVRLQGACSGCPMVRYWPTPTFAPTLPVLPIGRREHNASSAHATMGCTTEWATWCQDRRPAHWTATKSR